MAALLSRSVETYNGYCAAGHDADFQREPNTLGPVDKPPFYAIPLYPGGPNTKGGLRADAQRRVLDWDDQPIPRLYAWARSARCSVRLPGRRQPGGGHRLRARGGQERGGGEAVDARGPAACGRQR
jgi:predicted oxidoreductase